MMLEEEQISFRSASLMFDGVEDYSHQIAEMIGLRNESNFIQVGVSIYKFLFRISMFEISYFIAFIFFSVACATTSFAIDLELVKKKKLSRL